LVELLEPRPPRHLGREALGIGEDLVHVGIAAADDLRGPGRKDIEGRASGPSGENGARVLLELAAPEVDVDDLAAVEVDGARHVSSGRALAFGLSQMPARPAGSRA